MPLLDPGFIEHILSSKLMLIIGAPFMIEKDTAEETLDKKRIAESVIIGVVTAVLTALLLAIAAHVFVIKDLQDGQNTIDLKMTYHLQSNEIAHQNIIDSHGQAMESIDITLIEIKDEMRKFRNDAYKFNGTK